MADVSGKFYSATKVRTGVSPSSPGIEQGATLEPVNPPGGGLNSVGLTMPTAFNVANSPLTSNGTIAVTGAGTVAQYVRGDGSLADFPSTTGGGSSVSYYLNGSVNQGTIGGIAYKELSKSPILGAGTDFTISADGYIASFITDAGDPNKLLIPAGNWNFETYFSASSSGGTPSFYVELYKVSGSTATLIASSSSAPELIAFGTSLNPYFSTLAVPETILTLTDRLAIRYYVNHSGRTITLHTENNHLCQVITTFTTGLTALNGLTSQVQYFAVGTSGTDFNIASATDTHTFNLPTASSTNRGALSSADWALFTQAYNDKINSASVTGTTTKTLTLTQQDGGTITASWTDLNTDAVTSVFGRTGAVVAANGDYTTAQVTESGNLYFTNARSRQAISLTTSGTSGAATYDNSTGVFNIPNYGSALSGYLPLTGGTLTGPLGGTSISLSGDITANRYRGVNSLVLNSYTTVNPSSNVYLYSPPNDRDAWIYLDSADTGSNWGIYHRQIDSAVSGLPANSIGFIGGGASGLQAWISLANGNGFFAGDLTANNLSGTNTGNVTIGTANGLSLSGQALSLGLASGSANGALSSTDWTTFNNKQNALTNPVTGTGTTNYLPKFTGSTTIGNSNLINDSSGNLGLGVTPSAGGLSGYVLFELANGGASIYSGPNQNLNGSNISWSGGTASYKISNFATVYNQQSGQHQWYTAPSGTAGNAISFTQAMTLFSDGNLLLTNGTVSNAGFKLDVNSSSYKSFRVQANDDVIMTFGSTIASSQYWTMAFTANGSAQGSNQFFIGTSTNNPSGLLTKNFTIASTGAATFSSSVNVGGVSANTDFRIYRTVDAGAYFSITAPGGSPLTSILGVSGTNVMSLNQSGNVGIGIDSPTNYSGFNTLHINGKSGTNGGVLRLTAFDNSSSFNIYAAASAANFNTTSAIPFVWLTQDTPRMTITSGGNVLIGQTLDLGFKLHVQGTGFFSSTLLVSAGNNGGRLRVGNINNAYAIAFEKWNSSLTLGGFYQNSGSSGEMILIDTNGNQNVLISSSNNSYFNASGGNVLIGTTTNSGDKLRVNGNTFTNTLMTWNPENDNRSGVAWRFGAASIASITPNRRLRVSVNGIEYYIGAVEV